jgi:hypothetical protein
MAGCESPSLLPPGFDLAAAMRSVLERRPVMLRSELDEQGL